MIRRGLVRALRVPPEPAPPAGSAASVRVFRASRRYYQYALFEWGMKQVGALLGILAFFQFQGQIVDLSLPDEVVERLAPIAQRFGADDPAGFVRYGVQRLLTFAEAVGFAALIAQLPFTYAIVRLDYEMRWYIVTDRSLRIREGIMRVREMTMTFANIQNVTIEKGPVQRLLGIADVKVRSAGGGSDDSDSGGAEKAASMHTGYFRGVDNAQEIRELVFERLRRMKSAGLGDPEDTADEAADGAADGLRLGQSPGSSGTPLDEARAVLAEARALRHAVEARPGAV